MFLSYTIPASSSSDTTFTGENGVYYGNNTTYGAYYTWCAATASKGRYCTDATTTVNDSEYSICPRGWKLPTIAQYRTLLSNAGITDSDAGSTKIRGKPYSFPYAGYVSYSSLGYVGSAGDYWSSTAYDSNNAYDLAFGSSDVVTTYSGRYLGVSIRCIAP